MRSSFLGLALSCLLLASGAYASEPAKKVLGEGPPKIEFNPMKVTVQGFEKIEYRHYSLRIELFNYSDLPEACKSVPRIVDAAINDFRSNPPTVTKLNKVDLPPMNARMKAVVLRFMNPKLVKRVWLEEGGSAGTGGVIDRLPNQCR